MYAYLAIGCGDIPALPEHVHCDAGKTFSKFGDISLVGGEDDPTATTGCCGDNCGIDVILSPTAMAGKEITDTPGQVTICVHDFQDTLMTGQERVNILVITPTPVLFGENGGWDPDRRPGDNGCCQVFMNRGNILFP